MRPTFWAAVLRIGRLTSVPSDEVAIGCHLLALGFFLGAYLNRQHQAGGILADGGDHLVEHVKTLETVHDDRVL